MNSEFVTYVIQMPDSQDARRAITQGLKALVAQHDGEITASGIGDEMTLAERLERRLSPLEADEARQEAAALERRRGRIAV